MSENSTTTATIQGAAKRTIIVRLVLFAAIAAVIVSLVVITDIAKRPDVANTPVAACDVLTKKVAHKLLGEVTVGSQTEPTINTETDVAMSKCSYTDMDKDDMSIVALAIQTGINDVGVAKNKQDFDLSQKANDVTVVPHLGDKAYFNKTNGQLHVLDGPFWVIVNYGKDGLPAKNDKQQNIDVAKLLLKDIKKER